MPKKIKKTFSIIGGGGSGPTWKIPSFFTFFNLKPSLIFLITATFPCPLTPHLPSNSDILTSAGLVDGLVIFFRSPNNVRPAF